MKKTNLATPVPTLAAPEVAVLKAPTAPEVTVVAIPPPREVASEKTEAAPPVTWEITDPTR